MHARLRRADVRCSEKRVRQVMREEGLPQRRRGLLQRHASRSAGRRAPGSRTQACSRPAREGARTSVRSDRGCHCRWPEWVDICDAEGLVRSMSAKGRNPDNAACEGFFGRLKNEFFH